jgi:hypothetical protein
LSVLTDEPVGRHLYVVDHHQCFANAVAVLIGCEVVLGVSLSVNPNGNLWEDLVIHSLGLVTHGQMN